MSDHRSLEQILQELLDHAQTKGSLPNTDLTQLQNVLSGVQVEGDLSVGNITQTLLNLLVFIPNSFKPTRTPHNLPRSGTIKFVGRSETLEDLHQLLQQNDHIALTAIEGMGGVGKTELALQYAQLHLLLGTYTGGICWLRARNEDIGLQIIRFAEIKLGLETFEDQSLLEKVDFCLSRWPDEKVLIIIDDVDDFEKVNLCLPSQPSQFKIVITTRTQTDLIQSLVVNVLTEVAAIELIKEWLGVDIIEKELTAAKVLCQQLGYLPLALNLASRYIKRRNITISELSRRLQKNKLNHESLKRKPNELTWTLNIQRGVADTFNLSWEELSEVAKQLGCLMSLFALAPIPWILVEKMEESWDLEELESARAELEGLYLLRETDSCYLMHQLVKEFFAYKLEQSRELEIFRANL